MPVDQQTFDLLRTLFIDAGGIEGFADVAAAVAMAESGGCQYALAGPIDIRPIKACVWNRTAGENSCGYWQINLYAHKQYSAPTIFGRVPNAEAAVAISDHGRSFHPWTMYTNGTYLQYLKKYGGGGGGGVPQPPPGHYKDGATVPPGVWNTGWKHLSHELAHSLPAALTHSQRVRQRTLRLIREGRKVVR